MSNKGKTTFMVLIILVTSGSVSAMTMVSNCEIKSADGYFETSKNVARIIAKNILLDGLAEGDCLNVNIPKCTPEELQGIKIWRLAKAVWQDDFDHRNDPGGKDYYWLTGEFKNFDKGEGTDEFALEHNYVSVVPAHYDLTAYHVLPQLQRWEF